VSTPLVYKLIQQSIFREIRLWGLLLSRGLTSCTTDTRSGKKFQSFFFGVSAILCQPLQYFQLFFLSVVHCLCCQNTTCFQKHVYAFVDFLGKVLVSALKVRKLLLKFLKNSRYRIRPFAVLKSFSISEVTLHNENCLLLLSFSAFQHAVTVKLLIEFPGNSHFLFP
jgi:hypothetical protein